MWLWCVVISVAGMPHLVLAVRKIHLPASARTAAAETAAAEAAETATASAAATTAAESASGRPEQWARQPPCPSAAHETAALSAAA